MRVRGPSSCRHCFCESNVARFKTARDLQDVRALTVVRQLAAARLAHLSSHHEGTYPRVKGVITDLINHLQVVPR